MTHRRLVRQQELGCAVLQVHAVADSTSSALAHRRGCDAVRPVDASEIVEPRTGRRRTARGPQPAAHSATSVLVLASPAASEEVRAEVDRQLRGTRAARTAISAVILAVLAWALYEHDFFGTAREMVSLFALGFTTDLSTDALFAALEKAKRA